jgi:WD40 repeat protein
MTPWARPSARPANGAVYRARHDTVDLRSVVYRRRPTRSTGIEILGVHDGQAEAVAWSPDSRHVATGARDTTVRIWAATTDLATQLAHAHQYIFRTLTSEERHNLGLLT